jgi:branched-chain amino acid transport system ATP-binding protein
MDFRSLTFTDVSRHFGRRRVLNKISLQCEAGEIVALLGSNGAGKTTTLNAIAGLVRPSGGRVTWRGEEIAGQAAYQIVSKGLALSPEGWRLFVSQTVEQNLRLGATTLADKSRIDPLFERVYALFPRLAERRRQSAGTLSGGERQMLALGRALMAKPRLLLLDEPSLGLAPLIVREIFRIVMGLRELGVSILLVEQNARAALETADHGYVLETGSIVLSGKASDLIHDPRVIASYLGGKVN